MKGSNLCFQCFPFVSVVKNLACQAGDSGSIPGSGRFSREGNGNPLQYSCLGNPRTEEPGGVQSMGSQRDTSSGINNNNNSVFNYEYSEIIGKVKFILKYCLLWNIGEDIWQMQMKIRLTDVLSLQKVIITNQYGCSCLQVSEFSSVQSLSRVEPDQTGFNRKVIGHVQS